MKVWPLIAHGDLDTWPYEIREGWAGTTDLSKVTDGLISVELPVFYNGESADVSLNWAPSWKHSPALASLKTLAPQHSLASLGGTILSAQARPWKHKFVAALGIPKFVNRRLRAVVSGTPNKLFTLASTEPTTIQVPVQSIASMFIKAKSLLAKPGRSAINRPWVGSASIKSYGRLSLPTASSADSPFLSVNTANWTDKITRSSTGPTTIKYTVLYTASLRKRRKSFPGQPMRFQINRIFVGNTANKYYGDADVPAISDAALLFLKYRMAKMFTPGSEKRTDKFDLPRHDIYDRLLAEPGEPFLGSGRGHWKADQIEKIERYKSHKIKWINSHLKPTNSVERN